MAKGNKTVVRGNNGRRVEVILGVGVTAYPGMALQFDYSVAIQNGVFTAVLYNRDADGNRPAGPILIMEEDLKIGKLATASRVAGERVMCYIPLPGDELNILLADIGGTADVHTKGEILIPDDGTGLFIATTGSPEIEPFILQETLAAPTANTRAWAVYSGY